MQDLKFRHEFKHFINMSDYVAIRARLRAVADSDLHADENGEYRIRSLYFDNVDDKVLCEKIDGVNFREKFRIRYYNDDYSFIKLEKKSKINGLCNKQSAKISREECEAILAGDLDWMARSDRPLIAELYSKMKFQLLKPRTLVDYMRQPFIYAPGNVRVTLDRDIRTGIHAKDLFNQKLPTVSTGAQHTILLEVKYDAFLPEVIHDIIQIDGRRATAFSKYAVCRIYG